MHRMDKWAEDEGLRSPWQFSFRRDRGTVEAAFVLRHVIGQSRHMGKPMFAAFIDFKKAYDRVDRTLLWQCLRSLGVPPHGACINTLQSMYALVELRIRTQGQLGPPFHSTSGVKQGDPLSPLLFGLLIDRFQDFMNIRTWEHGNRPGVTVGGEIVSAILYADDLVLMANSPTELTQLLRALDDFSAAIGLHVNTDKSEVVIFNRTLCDTQPAHARRWRIAGALLPVKEEFSYLGIHVRDTTMTRCMRKAMMHAVTKGRAALFTMMAQARSIRIANPHLLGRLFDAIVEPVMSYGVEVWGPESLAWCKGNVGKGEAETVQRLFMRMVLGVGKATPIATMMKDMGRQPIMIRWLRRV